MPTPGVPVSDQPIVHVLRGGKLPAKARAARTGQDGHLDEAEARVEAESSAYDVLAALPPGSLSVQNHRLWCEMTMNIS